MTGTRPCCAETSKGDQPPNAKLSLTPGCHPRRLVLPGPNRPVFLDVPEAISCERPWCFDLRHTAVTRHRHTIAGPRSGMSASQQGERCADACHVHTELAREVGWLRAAAWAKALAWMSLVWMYAEGALGLWQGFAVGSNCAGRLGTG